MNLKKIVSCYNHGPTPRPQNVPWSWILQVSFHPPQVTCSHPYKNKVWISKSHWRQTRKTSPLLNNPSLQIVQWDWKNPSRDQKTFLVNTYWLWDWINIALGSCGLPCLTCYVRWVLWELIEIRVWNLFNHGKADQTLTGWILLLGMRPWEKQNPCPGELEENRYTQNISQITHYGNIFWVPPTLLNLPHLDFPDELAQHSLCVCFIAMTRISCSPTRLKAP